MEIQFNPHLRRVTNDKIKKKPATSGESFASHLTASQDPAETTSSSSIAFSQNLFAAQEVPPHQLERQALKKRGTQLLDNLDAIRLALLEGRVSIEMLETLKQDLAEPTNIEDPDCRLLLDEIETRLAVELAKLGRVRTP